MKQANLDKATILFAGDSGDGMQLTGSQFTDTSALFGNDLSTFPDFPAEIRAPKGTVAGVSGFQVRFGSKQIFSPGDSCDVLVAMNAAALIKSGDQLKQGGILIANEAGFDKKNLKLAGSTISPLEDEKYVGGKHVHIIDITKLTKEALKEFGLSSKDVDRSKNMFVLGFVYWLYNRSLEHTLTFLADKFKSKPEIAQANTAALKAGYHYGETAGIFTERFTVPKAKLAPGNYRNISGNHATAIGLVAAAKQADLKLFYGGYPITPASDILHYLSKYKKYGVTTFQAEDEIAGVTAAIGASFGGQLGSTASSGPGIALKGEALGLAVMLEIPLVIINVQRGGPSTGLPTKTEQSDLNQALYGRNGDAPIPVLSPKSPSDCFNTAFEASKIAVEHMTPVLILSDGFVANGSEPWQYPKTEDLGKIAVNKAAEKDKKEGEYLPYKRNEQLVRSWAVPGQKGFEHRVGGLEKENETGNISYGRSNHQLMTDLRQGKIDKIQEVIPDQEIESGPNKGSLAILTWGSTFGSIKTALEESDQYRDTVAHIHLRHILPLPKNLKDLLSNYDKLVIPELNNGQLLQYLRGQLGLDIQGFSKVEGSPFNFTEIIKIIESQ
ncbi:2-oxoacid:acceptor oxidoreductase subunit alpha [Flavobacteriaceae bacterium]|nr:2-oxoacid:acceptor oxidoreductase subunit alpha [Flavobacteriaceae bacterium]